MSVMRKQIFISQCGGVIASKDNYLGVADNFGHLPFEAQQLLMFYDALKKTAIAATVGHSALIISRTGK